MTGRILGIRRASVSITMGAAISATVEPGQRWRTVPNPRWSPRSSRPGSKASGRGKRTSSRFTARLQHLQPRTAGRTTPLGPTGPAVTRAVSAAGLLSFTAALLSAGQAGQVWVILFVPVDAGRGQGLPANRVCGEESGTGAEEVVELAVLDGPDEHGNLGGRVDQRRAGRMARIADRDLPSAKYCELDAAPVRVAVLALTPCGSVEPGR